MRSYKRMFEIVGLALISSALLVVLGCHCKPATRPVFNQQATVVVKENRTSDVTSALLFGSHNDCKDCQTAQQARIKRHHHK